MNAKWDKRFLRLTVEISTWSKDPSSKVGAIIVSPENRIVSTGYNGFPINTDDSKDIYSNRERKYKRIIHAEKNAILFAKINLSNCIIYSSFFPCTQCAASIIQCGITRVVSIKPSDDYIDRWSEDIQESILMFREAGIRYVMYPPEDLER